MNDKPDKEDVEEAAADAEDADADADAEGGDEKQAAGKKRRFSLKLGLSPKKLLMLGLPALVFLGGGGYFAFSMIGSSESGAGAPSTVRVYYDMPEMVVNLSTDDKRTQYLKLKVSLEAPDQEVINALTPVMPRVLDMFQLYLRELRSSDLEGSAGIFRLKEELLRRINLEIHPKQVERVLFKEIIVQ